MKEVGQILLALGAAGLGLGVMGAAMYGPILLVRYLFLRIVGTPHAETLDHITRWKLFPDETQVVKVPYPVYPKPSASEDPQPPPREGPRPRAKKENIYAAALKPDPVDTTVHGAQIRKGKILPWPKRVLLDECMWPAHQEEFKADGYDVTHVRDIGMAGASDEANLEYAVKNRRVFVTFDTDLLIIDHQLQGQHCGILKLPFPANAKGVVALFRQHWS